MDKKAKEIKSFFYGQAFADGFRISFSILLPALIAFHFNYKAVGMAISLGALCVSITDAPGPLLQRRNGMLFCSFFIFLISLLTAVAKTSVVSMGLEIAFVSFFFSMFNVYGNRAAAVGSALILMMILTMDDPSIAGNAFLHSSLILIGGLWYLLLSLLSNAFMPYRLAQRNLGDCIREIANYLFIKGRFYDPSTELKENYSRLVSQQILVNEKLDSTREVLFKTRETIKESTPMGRKLVMTFVEAVDFFEDTTATFYDYKQLRERFGNTGILERISKLITNISTELDDIGLAIQVNGNYVARADLNILLVELKTDIDAVQSSDQSNLVLKKILVNLRNLVQRIDLVRDYFSADVNARTRSIDHTHFVSHQPLSFSIFLNNITLESSPFRHSLRVAFACVLAFFVVRIIDYGQHSYWVLLTVAFILKPAFSLTKQRNKERIIGTVIGGAVGGLILFLVSNTTVLFILMVLLMISTYSFLRTNYLAMVLSVTPFVLILFNFLGLGFVDVVQERILDTVIGCAIAFPVSYLLLPSWESDQLKTHLKNVLEANANYLVSIIKALSGQSLNLLEYKLVRKEVYVHTANLTALFQRMLSEPRNKQKKAEHVHQFVVMNHIFFSNIAHLGTSLFKKEKRAHSKQLQATAYRVFVKITEIVSVVDPTYKPPVIAVVKKEIEKESLSQDDLLIKDQLEYLVKLAEDVKKTVAVIEA
jgi:uncharacterized membrane protein (TIGR01666 family)